MTVIERLRFKGAESARRAAELQDEADLRAAAAVAHRRAAERADRDAYALRTEAVEAETDARWCRRTASTYAKQDAEQAAWDAARKAEAEANPKAAG